MARLLINSTPRLVAPPASSPAVRSVMRGNREFDTRPETELLAIAAPLPRAQVQEALPDHHNGRRNPRRYRLSESPSGRICGRLLLARLPAPWNQANDPLRLLAREAR